jgi:hypothetical protein
MSGVLETLMTAAMVMAIRMMKDWLWEAPAPVLMSVAQHGFGFFDDFV